MLIEDPVSSPIKIAVFDTGCDIDHPFFNGPGLEQRDEIVARWLDCAGEATEPLDEDANQHGTAITTLLSRLLPGAEIYVVRIARDLDGLSAAKTAIADVRAQRNYENE
jgi:subtilisin family serine protease